MKGLSKLATILLLSTGIAFSSGKAIAGDKSLMSKGLHEMTLQERTQWNYDKSMIDYGNTDDPDESFKDYIVRGGSVVNQDGVKTKSDVEERSLNKRELKDDIGFFCGNYNKQEEKRVIKEGERFNCWINFYEGLGKKELKDKFFIVKKNEKEIIHYEEDVGIIDSSRQWTYPNSKGMLLEKGNYDIFLIGEYLNGEEVYNKHFTIEVIE